MAKNTHNPADYIVPLNINGLQGRMLHIPAPNSHAKREMLFIYGHHSSLERWWGLMEVLNRYGSVTMPDIPGFGGMDSFYKLGQKPTIDNFADYLAAFIKWRYKRKKVTLVGLSFGFLIITRMLQKYPELVGKVDMLVSIVGFAHQDDFKISKTRYWFYRGTSTIFLHNPMALIFRYVALNSHLIRLFYAKTHNAKKKFAQAKDEADFKRLMDVEVDLWHKNDVRTQMFTTIEFLTLNNCTDRVDLPVWHIATENDNYFDHNLVEQHMRLIFTDFHLNIAKMSNHAPSVIADAKMAESLIPLKLRKLLAER